MGLYTFANEGQIGGDIDLDQVEDYGYEPTLESGFMIAMEAEQNYNEIIKAVAIHELNVYAETGEDVIYEAVDIRGFFEKVKEFFKKLLAKVAALCKSFVTKFNSLVQNDKEFVKKYGPKILTTKVDTNDFSYKGYEFKHMDWSISDKLTEVNEKAKAIESVKNVDAKDYISDDKDTEDEADGYRGQVLKGTDEKIESSDFAKEIRRYFRNDEDSKTQIDKVDPKEQLNYISGSKDATKSANDNLRNFKRAIDTITRALNSAEKELTHDITDKTKSGDQETNTKKLVVIQDRIRQCETYMSIVNQVNAGYLAAIKDRNRQARAICAKLVSYKTDRDSGKRKLNTESYTGSFLDGVVLK